MESRTTIDDDAVEARLREKVNARLRDLERLRRGEVTPEELQAENSLFSAEWMEARVIENFYENVGH